MGGLETALVDTSMHSRVWHRSRQQCPSLTSSGRADEGDRFAYTVVVMMRRAPPTIGHNARDLRAKLDDCGRTGTAAGTDGALRPCVARVAHAWLPRTANRHPLVSSSRGNCSSGARIHRESSPPKAANPRVSVWCTAPRRHSRRSAMPTAVVTAAPLAASSAITAEGRKGQRLGRLPGCTLGSRARGAAPHRSGPC